MSTHSRTSRPPTAAVVLLVVCIIGVMVVATAAAAADDDDRALTDADDRQRRESSHRQHEHRQHISDCSAVHQFARHTMQYTGVLPTTKTFGTFCAVFPGDLTEINVVQAVEYDWRLLNCGYM